MKLKIILKDYDKRDLCITDIFAHFPEVASLIKAPNITIGKLGKKYQSSPANRLRTEKNMDEDQEIAAYFPIYGELDKFGDLNNLTVQEPKTALEMWDSGIVGYVIYTREFLKENLRFRRVSRKKKFSKNRADIMRDYLNEDIYQLRSYFCSSYLAAVEDEMGEQSDLGIISIRRDYEEAQVIKSIEKELVERCLISEENLINYDIVIKQSIKDYMASFQRNFSWDI